MKTYTQQPAKQSRTLASNSKASRQAPLDVILKKHAAQHRTTPAINNSIVQCTIDEQTIIRLCNKHGIHVTEKEAKIFLSKLKEGLAPRIRNHKKVLKPHGKHIRVIKNKFSGEGPMGRTDKESGTIPIISDSHFYELPEKFTSEMIIDKDSIAKAAPSTSLLSVMGQSAFAASEIADSEWLHRIGRQLGGKNSEDNLIAGFHATNTAMIPIENMVHEIANEGVRLDYKVQLLPRPGITVWSSDAVIAVKFKYSGKEFEKIWQIEVIDDKHLDHNSYLEIVKMAKDFKAHVFG